MLTAKEMSSFLTTRYIFSDPVQNENMQPHQEWDTSTRAAIVILWGLLIYPQLDPDLRKNAAESISYKRFRNLMMEYLGEKHEFVKILYLLKKHDYIRFTDNKIVPGTGLFIAVNASKLYRHFRSSMLARELDRQLK